MSGNAKMSFCLLLSIVVHLAGACAETLPTAAHWIPDDAVICLELSQPKALLDLLADDKAGAAVKALPMYRNMASQPKFKEFLGVVNFIEVALETDWRTGIAALTGGGITIAVCPNDTIVTIIDAEDERMLERLHEILLNNARSEADKAGEPGRVVSAEYLGVKGWTFNGKEAHAILGKRMIIANRPEGLKAVLEMRAKSSNATLASTDDYKAAKKAVGPDAVGMVMMNLEVLKNIPDLAGLLAQDKTNPLTALLFAGITETVRNSTSMALGLHIADDKLVLQAHLDGKGVNPTGPAGFAVPGKPDQGAMPNLSVPRCIASFSFYRDLHRFYGAKDDLFGERTSGLIFFENMMGIFFSGRDLTDEVFGETTPDIRFVIARQEYDGADGTPATQMPAFALILRLRDAEEFDEIAEEAWQKAIGLVNFTRGQQAMPGLIIDRPVHNGTKFTVAYFSTAGLEETANLHSRFNYRPSLAVSGDYLILSSTDGLTRDLIDAVNREGDEATGPLPGTHTVAELNGGELAAILKANRETMVRANMVKEGNTQEAAETSTDLLITLAGFIDHLELRIGTEDRLTKARLEIQPKLQ